MLRAGDCFSHFRVEDKIVVSETATSFLDAKDDAEQHVACHRLVDTRAELENSNTGSTLESCYLAESYRLPAVLESPKECHTPAPPSSKPQQRPTSGHSTPRSIDVSSSNSLARRRQLRRQEEVAVAAAAATTTPADKVVLSERPATEAAPRAAKKQSCAIDDTGLQTIAKDTVLRVAASAVGAALPLQDCIAGGTGVHFIHAIKARQSAPFEATTVDKWIHSVRIVDAKQAARCALGFAHSLFSKLHVLHTCGGVAHMNLSRSNVMVSDPQVQQKDTKDAPNTMAPLEVFLKDFSSATFFDALSRVDLTDTTTEGYATPFSLMQNSAMLGRVKSSPCTLVRPSFIDVIAAKELVDALLKDITSIYGEAEGLHVVAQCMAPIEANLLRPTRRPNAKSIVDLLERAMENAPSSTLSTVEVTNPVAVYQKEIAALASSLRATIEKISAQHFMCYSIPLPRFDKVTGAVCEASSSGAGKDQGRQPRDNLVALMALHRNECKIHSQPHRYQPSIAASPFRGTTKNTTRSPPKSPLKKQSAPDKSGDDEQTVAVATVLLNQYQTHTITVPREHCYIKDAMPSSSPATTKAASATHVVRLKTHSTQPHDLLTVMESFPLSGLAQSISGNIVRLDCTFPPLVGCSLQDDDEGVAVRVHIAARAVASSSATESVSQCALSLSRTEERKATVLLTSPESTVPEVQVELKFSLCDVMHN